MTDQDIIKKVEIGVDIDDFSLTKDGAPVSLAGVTVTGIGSNYSIDLIGVTGADGSYILTLLASGSAITDLAGNPLESDATQSWLNGVQASLVSVIVPVASPAPLLSCAAPEIVPVPAKTTSAITIVPPRVAVTG